MLRCHLIGALAVLSLGSFALAGPALVTTSRQTTSSGNLSGFPPPSDSKSDLTTATLSNWGSGAGFALDSVSAGGHNTSTSSIATHLEGINSIFDQLTLQSLTGSALVGTSLPRAVQQGDTQFTWTVQFTTLNTSTWSFTGDLAGLISGTGAQTTLKIGVFNGSIDQTQTFTGNFNLTAQTLGGTIAPGAYSFIIDAHSLVDFPNGSGLSEASFAVNGATFAVPEPGMVLIALGIAPLAGRRVRR
ncbi:MAG TPA: hypothetical protein VH518_14320 [Tepidisphaeraceae bacterium]|jgi:hypothetical protein